MGQFYRGRGQGTEMSILGMDRAHTLDLPGQYPHSRYCQTQAPTAAQEQDHDETRWNLSQGTDVEMVEGKSKKAGEKMRRELGPQLHTSPVSITISHTPRSRQVILVFGSTLVSLKRELERGGGGVGRGK